MIFNLFKSKPSLKELIPNGFVDIHSHILPGIDDGAKNIEESLALISKMKEMGFSKIIATPHTYPGLYDNTCKTILDSYKMLKKKKITNIEISYASEYMIESSIIDRIENKSLLTLKNKHVLIEMSFISAPRNLYEVIFQLQLNNFIPVLAHPERYLYIDYDEFNKLKKIGCKFQLNLLSTTGYYGNLVSKTCDKLLKNELIDFVGSDIHSMKQINAFKNKTNIKEVNKLEKAIDSNSIFM